MEIGKKAAKRNSNIRFDIRGSAADGQSRRATQIEREVPEKAMKRKMTTIVALAAAAMMIGGCSGQSTSDTPASASKSVQDESKEPEAKVADNSEEQETAKAKADADEIDAQHQEDAQGADAVEQAVFEGVIPRIEGADDWVRTESVTGEDGISRETYQCDEELKFFWESGAADSGEVQESLAGWAAGKNWEISQSGRDDQMSEALNAEVYGYQAYEDDNGYSMYHQGSYVINEGRWYAVDFEVMEGFFGDYYDTITEALGKLTLA